MVAFLFVGSISDLVTAKRLVTVDKRGHGDFPRVQHAMDSVPLHNVEWTRIRLRPGIYKYDHVLPRGTSSQFKWSPALVIEADKVAFYQSGFIGIQDTSTDWTGRHYFKSCYIEGPRDFIWSGGQSIYQNSYMYVKASLLRRQLGFNTAQSREKPTDTNGFVFKRCIIEGTGSAYLGRAHREYARVFFYRKVLPSLIVSKGWSAWSYTGHEESIMFAEEMCTLAGANKAELAR